jgi:hypothetical protein
MIYAATRGEVETRRKAFIRKWRLKCRAVADSLEEAGYCTSQSRLTGDCPHLPACRLMLRPPAIPWRRPLFPIHEGYWRV